MQARDVAGVHHIVDGMIECPVGKIFHRGRLVGDFMGGSLAHEIVAEMLSVRDDLRRAEEATEADKKAARAHLLEADHAEHLQPARHRHLGDGAERRAAARRGRRPRR